MMGYTTIESMLRRFEREGRRDAFPLSDSFPQWQAAARKTLSGLLGLQYLEAVDAAPVIISREEAEGARGLIRRSSSLLPGTWEEARRALLDAKAMRMLSV